MARAGTPLYLYQREIQPVEPVSLERCHFEEQQENSGKQDEEEDGILEYWIRAYKLVCCALILEHFPLNS